MDGMDPRIRSFFALAFLAFIVGEEAIPESDMSVADLPPHGNQPAALPAALPPPFAPHSAESEYANQPPGDPPAGIIAQAPIPIFGNATDLPIRRSWSPGAALGGGSGDAAWLHAAAQASPPPFLPNNSIMQMAIRRRPNVAAAALLTGDNQGWL
jgi:hypothetical protein